MEQVSPAPAASAPLILNNREDLLRNHAALHFQQDSLDYESRRIRDHGTHKGVHGSTMPSAFGIIDSEVNDLPWIYYFGLFSVDSCATSLSQTKVLSMHILSLSLSHNSGVC